MLTIAGHPSETRAKEVFSEYRDVLKADEELSKSSSVKHHINMDGGHVPRLPYRMVPPSMFKEFVQHLGQLLAKKLIRKSSRQYANPVVLVGKKTGGIRMCVDYRLLDNPLTHIMTQKRLSALEQRWVNALAGYNFTIKYRPGKHNANANDYPGGHRSLSPWMKSPATWHLFLGAQHSLCPCRPYWKQSHYWSRTNEQCHTLRSSFPQHFLATLLLGLHSFNRQTQGYLLCCGFTSSAGDLQWRIGRHCQRRQKNS